MPRRKGAARTLSAAVVVTMLTGCSPTSTEDALTTEEAPAEDDTSTPPASENARLPSTARPEPCVLLSAQEISEAMGTEFASGKPSGPAELGLSDQYSCRWPVRGGGMNYPKVTLTIIRNADYDDEVWTLDRVLSGSEEVVEGMGDDATEFRSPNKKTTVLLVAVGTDVVELGMSDVGDMDAQSTAARHLMRTALDRM